ncbi:MAG: hypothetical protein H0X27_01830 [Caulobacteraceae bacterium]|nr:hypothetical protein [Caulobacteraceae bacterium]
MRNLLVGVAGLSIALAAACGASAQATPPPAANAAPSVETTTIGDLLANPTSQAVIAKDMPDLITYPGLDQIKGMTLRDISKYPQAKLDDAKLAAVQKDLDAAKKP